MDGEELVQLLTDEYGAKILVATYRSPKSALELSQKLGIPIAACYRRIHALENVGLLECVGVERGLKGKKIKLYKSKIKQVMIYFERGNMRVKLVYENGEIKNIVYPRGQANV
ncbi:MAG: ArsR family transcriptional regulator [Thermoplasmata archaeon]|nr:MAG: ArsR family transcriptional regulator [Thermoplasmata archaeon]